MENINIIIDTSILIDYFRGRSSYLEQLILEQKRHAKLFVPYVVIAELFAGQEAKRKSVREMYERTITKFHMIELSATSAKKAGEIIRTYKQIPDPIDSIIAAIALEQNAQIATHNKKHFSQIKGVMLYKFSE